MRSIHYMGHIKMMGAVQPFISGAISKTVNVPKAATVEDIEQAYIDAWRIGAKAVSIYRDGSKRTQPLNTSRDKQAAAAEAVGLAQPHRHRLEDERQSITHKFEIAGHEGYITVGLYDDGQPGELFLTMAKEGSTISGFADAFAQAISYALQYGVPLQDLVDKFSHVRFEPAGMTKNPDIRFAKSIVDYIFRWMAAKFLSAEAQYRAGVNNREETVDVAGTVDARRAGAWRGRRLRRRARHVSSAEAEVHVRGDAEPGRRAAVLDVRVDHGALGRLLQVQQLRHDERVRVGKFVSWKFEVRLTLLSGREERSFRPFVPICLCQCARHGMKAIKGTVRTIRCSLSSGTYRVVVESVVGRGGETGSQRGLIMFVGHLAVALGAKKIEPRLSLPALTMAAFGLDVLWPLFLLGGLEVVRIDPGNTKFTPLDFVSYPWSHSLVMSLVWGALAAALTSATLGSSTCRHRHGRRRRQPLGARLDHAIDRHASVAGWSECSGSVCGIRSPATIAVEGALFAAGIALYLSATRPRDAVGRWAFVALILVVTGAWLSGPFTPPPPSVAVLTAMSVVLIVVFYFWSAWIERHREGVGLEAWGLGLGRVRLEVWVRFMTRG